MYLNTLICLEENVSGYGKSTKGPSGHITIMSPGIIKCYVQNLRNLPKEYTVYLISKNENKAVRLGNINAEDTNKQTTWKVDLDNLQGTRLKGKDIDCAAVVVEGETIGKTDTVLVGYAKDKYLITSMLESALPKKQNKPEITKPSKSEEAYEEKAPCECESCGSSKSEMHKPEIGGPGPVIMPIPAVSKPEMHEKEMHKPEMHEKEMHKPEMHEKEMHKPEMHEKEMHKLEMHEKEMHKPEMHEKEMCKPEMHEKEIHKPEMHEKEMHKPMHKSETEIVPECKKKMNTESEELARYIQSMQQEQEELDAQEQDEIKVLMRLKNLLYQSSDKETLATRVQSIIDASMNPFSKAETNTYEAIRDEASKELEVDEEREYLNKIESVLKSIQQNLGIESEEKKTIVKENLEEEKDINFKKDLLRVRDIFLDSTEIEPFEKKDENIDWVRISMAELISMPQFSYEWCTNPFVTYCYHKFGFLILGKDKHIEQYYIGIPDVYDTKRKFILSIDKIEAFRGRSSENLKPGDYGYWIVRV